MADIIDKSALDQFCRDYKYDMLAVALTGQNMLNDFNVIPGIKDEYVLTQLKLGNLIKPYTKNWDPSTGGVLTPRTLKVRLGKVELEEEPLKYRNTYLGKLMKAGVDEKDHPFEQYLVEEIMKKIKDDINLGLLFLGDYNAAGVTAADINDGFLTIIADDQALGVGAKLTPISVGVVDNTAGKEAVARMKFMYRSLPLAYRSIPINIYCSYTDYDLYLEDYQKQNGALPYNQSYEKVTLEGSNGLATFKPQSGFGTSRRIIMTPQENMCVGVDLASDMEQIGFNYSDVWVVKFFARFAFGVQFGSFDALFINDQE